ncbi:MAG: glutaredoxin family protein [Dehalococcoidia bacterium]
MSAPPVVTLYGRADCHLCDEARALLEPLARELGLRLVEVDIDSDPAAELRYRWAIPVVCVEGGEVARAPIRRGPLEAALRAAAASAQAR